MLADRQKQNSSQLKQLRSLTVDKSWNAEKPENCVSKSSYDAREAAERQNADGAITNNERWHRPNIVHV